MMYDTLLTLHIAAGFLSLACASGSILTKSFSLPHRWHRRMGTLFFGGMIGVFATALPMTFLRPNTFLFLTAVFSFYLALTGWRFAKNRRGGPHKVDHAITMAILITSIGMFARGISMLASQDSMGWVMIVFATLGTVFGIADGFTFRTGGVQGNDRIAKHVSRMMGGTIATLTAFIVTNFRMDPMVVLWLGPGMIIGPLAFVWVIRLKNGSAKWSLR